MGSRSERAISARTDCFPDSVQLELLSLYLNLSLCLYLYLSILRSIHSSIYFISDLVCVFVYVYVYIYLCLSTHQSIHPSIPDLEALLLLELVELGHELDGADQLQHPHEPAAQRRRDSGESVRAAEILAPSCSPSLSPPPSPPPPFPPPLSILLKS